MPQPPAYRPPRQAHPPATGDPLEIELVFQVSGCGTCSFFWPQEPAERPYGPFPTFDFLSDEPATAPAPDPATTSFPWLRTQTAPPAFPNPEIMDGCRKAPIMTIGINPNLTAFAPGPIGASWCYPNFSSEGGTDLYAKTAYYYRYRSIYQEHLDAGFIDQFLLAAPRVIATRPGTIVSVERPTSSPSFTLKVRYDGDGLDSEIPLSGALGAPRWVVLYDPAARENHFNAGDLLAAQLDVPAGQDAEIVGEQIGYYEQFVPVLERYQSYLEAHGHRDVKLSMGEDVGQLDMVACASPHWSPGFLGGSDASEQEIVANCVSTNGWAMRQLVQTRPAVLYLVGEASWGMFWDAFGALVERDPPLSTAPADGAFTLLRETIDPQHPCQLHVQASVDGVDYELSTRLVITPHFSYNENFLPQIRLSPSDWKALQANSPDAANFLRSDPRAHYVPGVEPDDYVAFLLEPSSAQSLLDELATRFPGTAAMIHAGTYDAHAMMSAVLEAVTESGELSYSTPPAGGSGLSRTDGACSFCVNEHWSFPLGCPYGKPQEAQPAAGFLDGVAAHALAAGKPNARRSASPTRGGRASRR